ncbi:MAG: hypothetical protein WD358_05405 [Nitriliruptoraceae bacterium]
MLLYIGVDMSFEEKGTWAYLAGAIVIPVIYAMHVFGQFDQRLLAEIVWVRPMITAIGAGIVVGIVASIFIGMAKPSEAGQRDVRDKEISRFGDFVGGMVLSVLAVGVLALTMLEVEHFWIANAIYAAFILQAITSSIVKLVAYRRGL